MCKTNTVGYIAGPDSSKMDGFWISTGTMNDTDMPEGAEGKVDITTSDKTNKTPILVNY